MDQVSGQVKEIKKLVVANQDSLLALHTNRDKPEIFYEVIKKVKSKFALFLLQIVFVVTELFSRPLHIL